MLNRLTSALLGMLMLALPFAFALHLLEVAIFSWQSTAASAILIFVVMVVLRITQEGE